MGSSDWVILIGLTILFPILVFLFVLRNQTWNDDYVHDPRDEDGGLSG